MIKGTSYTDTMDESRTIVPTGNGDECRVYFDNDYVGNANVPRRLFDLDEWQAKRFGFVPTHTMNFHQEVE
jgi:hypothetical protein